MQCWCWSQSFVSLNISAESVKKNWGGKHFQIIQKLLGKTGVVPKLLVIINFLRHSGRNAPRPLVLELYSCSKTMQKISEHVLLGPSAVSKYFNYFPSSIAGYNTSLSNTGYFQEAKHCLENIFMQLYTRTSLFWDKNSKMLRLVNNSLEDPPPHVAQTVGLLLFFSSRFCGSRWLVAALIQFSQRAAIDFSDKNLMFSLFSIFQGLFSFFLQVTLTKEYAKQARKQDAN